MLVLWKKAIMVLSPHTLDIDQRRRYEAAMASPASDTLIIMQAMMGIMTIAKEVKTGRDGNTEYLEKRSKAVCATQGIQNQFETGVLQADDMAARMVVWQGYIKPRAELRYRFIQYVQEEGLPSGSSGLLIAALDQMRMVLKDWGMKSILCMEAFISTKNRALELAPIAQQAVDLMAALKTATSQKGASFSYMELYPLAGSEKLHHRNYPDLYFAAIRESIASGDLGKEGRFIMTDVQTQLPKNVIEEACEKRVRAVSTLDDVTKANLEKLGYTLPENYDFEKDDSAPPSKRRR